MNALISIIVSVMLAGPAMAASEFSSHPNSGKNGKSKKEKRELTQKARDEKVEQARQDFLVELTNYQSPNLRMARVSTPTRVGTGQVVQLGIGTAAFMVGQVGECFLRAQYTHDDMIYQACIDSLKDISAWADMAVFGFFSQASGMTLRAMISTKSWAYLNSYLIQNGVLTLNALAANKVTSKIALGTGKVLGNHLISSGLGMTAGSFATHFFSKFHTSEQYKQAVKFDREMGFWGKNFDETKKRIDEIDVELATGNLKAQSKANLAEFNKQIDKIKNRIDNLGREIERTKKANPHSDVAQVFVLQKEMERLSEMAEAHSPQEILEAERDKLIEFKELCADKKAEYQTQYWKNMKEARDFMQTVTPKEWEQLKTDAARMFMTTTLLSTGWWTVKNSPYVTAGFTQKVQDFAKTIRPESEEAGYLMSKFGQTDITKLGVAQQRYAIGLIMKERVKGQIVQLTSPYLPQSIRFGQSIEEKMFLNGPRELYYAFDKNTKVFKIVGDIPFETLKDSFSPARLAYLRLYKWGFKIAGSQVVNAVGWLSVDRILSQWQGPFKYNFDLSFTHDWDESTKVMTLAQRVDEAKNRLVTWGTLLSKNDDEFRRTMNELDRQTAQGLLNEKKTVLEQMAKEQNVDIKQWASEMVALPILVQRFQQSLEQFHEIFKVYREEIFLKKFNEHFQLYMKKHTDRTNEEYKQKRFLDWMYRGLKANADVSLLEKGIVWLQRNRDKSAKVLEMFKDDDFVFNGTEDPLKVQANEEKLADPNSDLYGEIAGKPWHEDPNQFPGGFEAEIKDLFAEFRTQGLDIKNLKFNFNAKGAKSVDEVLGKFGLTEDSPNQKCVKLSQGVRCEFTGPYVIKAYTVHMADLREQDEKRQQIVFKAALDKDVHEILPENRVNQFSKDPLSPYEQSYEYEFGHLRDALLKIAASVPNNHPIMVDMVRAFMEVKGNGRSFVDVDLNRTMADVEEKYAALYTPSMIVSSFNKSQEERNGILGIQFLVATQNLIKAFVDIRGQAGYLLSLEFDKIEKCGGFGSENLTKNSKIDVTNPLDKLQQNKLQEILKTCQER